MRADVRPGRKAWRTIVCAMAVGAFAGSAAAAEPLRSIAEILALEPDELHDRRPVVIRGVVTLTEPVVIQEGDHALSLSSPASADDGTAAGPRPTMDPPPEIGTELEVEGFVDPGGRAPTVAVESVRRLGRRPLPAAVPLDPAQFYAGALIWRRITAPGVVQAVLDNPEGWSLIVESASRRFRIIILKKLAPARPDWLIDADSEFVGVNTGGHNSRGEFVSPTMRVASLDDIRMVHPPPQAAFELPITPLATIARFRVQPPRGHRVRTTGVVTFAVPGMLYVQGGVGGVRIDLAPDPGVEQVFEAGDQVDVAGFLDVTSGVGALVWAVARRTSSGPAPPPVPIQPRDVVNIAAASGRTWTLAQPGNYDGCLVRCTGRLEAVNASTTGTILTLVDRQTAFTVTLADAQGSRASRFVPGSDMEITGIVRGLSRGNRVGDIVIGNTTPSQVDILVRAAGEIRVVRLPPWWTPRRLGVAAAVAATLAVAAFGWVSILRREVSRQTARAVAEESARFASALDYEITLRERNRLAANLHDTVLQTVTGIAFQLKVCEAHGRQRSPEPDGEADVHLTVARKMVDHAAEQLRGTVWSLRSLPTDGRSLAAALEELCDRAGAGHDARIGLWVDPRVESLPASVAGNLLLVVQEAVHNALHHAEPRAVDVRVEADGTESIRIDVTDDGQGFELGTQAGPRQGHFGLAGMRERVDGLGGTLAIDTAPRRGTRVRIRVPLRTSPAAGVHS
jgi:signal transduction histidine kinase